MAEPLGGHAKTPELPYEAAQEEPPNVILSTIDGRTKKVVGEILDEVTDAPQKPTIDGGMLAFNVKYKSEQAVIRLSVPMSDIAELLHIQVADVQRFVESEKFDDEYANTLEAESIEFKEAGLSFEEMRTFSFFYDTKTDELKALTIPKFYSRREPQDPPLPRSVIYNPSEPDVGLYILLKTHGGIPEVGRGGHHTVTQAIHLDTAEIVTWRTALATKVSREERNTNLLLRKFPDYFVAGFAVEYEGPWRDREDEAKEFLREEKVKKTGFITEYCPRGDLFTLIDKEQQKPIKEQEKATLLQSHPEETEIHALELAAVEASIAALEDPLLAELEKLRLACELVECLVVLHTNPEIMRVHRDLKPENCLITATGRLKLADFGYCRPIGFVTEKIQGSAGYIAPEMIRAVNANSAYIVTTAIDIWSCGCLLADWLVGPAWVHWTGQAENQWQKMLDESATRLAKRTLFPHWEDENHPHFHINICLSLEPGARPSAQKLALDLRKIYDAKRSAH